MSRCSETGCTVQLHFRRPDVVLGTRVVRARVRRRRHPTVRARSVRLGWPCGPGRRRHGQLSRRRARGGRGRTGAPAACQHDGRPSGLHAPASAADRGAPVGRVRVQLARHQRPHVVDRLHAELGRQADHFRYVCADVIFH